MKLIVRFTTVALVVALSLACSPRSGVAGTTPPPNAKTCYFVRNHLPCPCPSARQARAVVHAASLTAGAIGNAYRTTAAALARGERARQPAN
jgi:hypothetical protein